MSSAKVGNTATSAVRIAELEGRGRSLVATKPLRAGEVILKDSPILLYSALPLHPQKPQKHHYCAHCFRLLSPSNPSIASCPSCSSAAFCNPNCASLAHASSHTPWVCQSLSRLLPNEGFNEELQVQARFLIAAFNLAVADPSMFRTLLSLQGENPLKPDHSVSYLHGLIFSLCPPLPQCEFGFSLELTAALLVKDKVNAFGLMEPFSEDGERSVRAYGLYPNASFFNHDCLPNACRFDYVDGSCSEGNTDIVVRLIHDIPQGREICVSYFPVNLTYSERQRRLKEDYGFTCVCDRCKVEVNWSDDEDEQGNVDEVEEEEEAMEEDNDEAMGDSDDGGVAEEDNFPHSYFFVRYMCSRNNCWGTLAPLPPGNGAPSTTMECNVCGSLRNDEEAMG